MGVGRAVGVGFAECWALLPLKGFHSKTAIPAPTTTTKLSVVLTTVRREGCQGRVGVDGATGEGGTVFTGRTGGASMGTTGGACVESVGDA